MDVKFVCLRKNWNGVVYIDRHQSLWQGVSEKRGLNTPYIMSAFPFYSPNSKTKTPPNVSPLSSLVLFKETFPRLCILHPPFRYFAFVPFPRMTNWAINNPIMRLAGKTPITNGGVQRDTFSVKSYLPTSGWKWSNHFVTTPTNAFVNDRAILQWNIDNPFLQNRRH